MFYFKRALFTKKKGHFSLRKKGTFYLEKGHSSRRKKGTFGVLDICLGGGGALPPPPPVPPPLACKHIKMSMHTFLTKVVSDNLKDMEIHVNNTFPKDQGQ